MGEVYKAKDTRLGRDVAIKVLPDRLARDPEALQRFEREAKALAALSHPNILTIFDFGSDKEVTFAVMELLEGETLRKKIERGVMTWNKMLEIALAITEGLAAAHSRGIIHRDLKPENIFMTSTGGVKILDFGLARLDAGAARTGESKMVTVSGTEPGTVLGTVGYMSPEQVRGQALDTRTDIFSLGCILYEMATGKCPFARSTAADTMAAILNYDPPELSASGKEIPPEMDRLILHCLEKNPEDRFQSSRDLAFDLKEVASGVRLTRPLKASAGSVFPFAKMLIAAAVIALMAAGFWWYKNQKDGAIVTEKIPVAVADFVNETGEKDLDGLSGMLITSLEQSKRLAVMTRSRMLDIVKQMGKDPEKIDEQLGREICKQSNTGALIIASIRKFDQLYTIDLKVLDPQKNEYLFTTKRQGTGKASVPDMIDKLSEETRSGLNEKAAEIQAANRKVTEVTTSNLSAYQHFFKGEEYINKLKFDDAEGEFLKAVAIDPNFALAYLRMAYAISWTNLERARGPIMKASQLIDKLPEKDQLMLKSANAYLNHDLENANKYLDQYLSQYPNEKEALFTRGDWAYHFGDMQTGITYFKRVLALDPHFERALQHLVWAYNATDQNGLAAEIAKSYVDQTKSGQAFQLLFQSLVWKGDLEGAEKLVARAEALFPNSPEVIRAKSEIYSAQMKDDESEAECKKLLPTDRDEGEICLKYFYAVHGRFNDAIQAGKNQIDIALEEKDFGPLANTYADIAYFHFAKGDRPAADHAIEEGLRYAKESDEVPHGLFDTLNEMNRTNDALKIGKEYLWGHRAYYEVSARAWQAFNRGDYSAAAKEFEFLTQKGMPFDKNYSFYALARCQMQMKKFDEAIRTLQKMQSYAITITTGTYGPKFYLLAQAYDQKGDSKSAKEYYKKFVTFWKNADPDLPQVIDARSRTR